VQVKNIGLFFTVNALSLLISRPLLGRLSKTYKEYILLPYAIVIFMIALFVFSISTHLIGFIISAVLLAFGFGLAHPLIQTLCMKSVPKERSGAASATNYYGMDIGYLLSPFIAGYLIDLLGYALMYRWLILALFISLILNFIFRKRLKAISDFI
jgi:MFS family permease